MEYQTYLISKCKQSMIGGVKNISFFYHEKIADCYLVKIYITVGSWSQWANAFE